MATTESAHASLPTLDPALDPATDADAALDCLVCTAAMPATEARETAMCGLCEAQPEAMPTCKSCMARYFQDKVKASYTGVCPRMGCLYHHERTVVLGAWERLVPREVSDVFRQRARETLSFQCGGCHSRRSYGDVPDSDDTAVIDGKLAVLPLAENKTLDELRSCIGAYACGEASHEATYERLAGFVPALDIAGRFQALAVLDRAAIKSAQEALDTCVRAIADPERRATLLLYHFQKVPRFYTRCCTVEHCFVCRQKGYHQGKTCAQNQRANSGRVHIVSCSECDVQLMKGDGCDSVSCYCGHSFGWTARLREMRALQETQREELMNAFREAFEAAWRARGSESNADAALAAALHQEAAELLQRFETPGGANSDVEAWTNVPDAATMNRLVGAEKLSRTFPDAFRDQQARLHASQCRAMGATTEEGIAAVAGRHRQFHGRFSTSAVAGVWISLHAPALHRFQEASDRYGTIEADRQAKALRANREAAELPGLFLRLYGDRQLACRAAVAITHLAANRSEVPRIVPASAAEPMAVRLLSVGTLSSWSRSFAQSLVHQGSFDELRGGAQHLLRHHAATRRFLEAVQARNGEARDIFTHDDVLEDACKEAFMRSLLASQGWGSHGVCESGAAVSRLWAFAKGFRSAAGNLGEPTVGPMAALVVEAIDTIFAGGLVPSDAREDAWTSRYGRVMGREPAGTSNPGGSHVPDDAAARAALRKMIKEETITSEQYVLVEVWAEHKGFDDLTELYVEMHDPYDNFFGGLQGFFATEEDEAEEETAPIPFGLGADVNGDLDVDEEDGDESDSDLGRGSLFDDFSDDAES